MSYAHKATCRFEVASWAEHLVVDIDGDGTHGTHGTLAGDNSYPNRGITRTEISYTYTGEIEGTSTLAYFIAYQDGAAPVLGLERFEGSIGGHDGTCVFQHVGSQDKGSVAVHVEVVPGMGTGGLERLRGEADLAISGHSDDGYPLVLAFDIG